LDKPGSEWEKCRSIENTQMVLRIPLNADNFSIIWGTICFSRKTHGVSKLARYLVGWLVGWLVGSLVRSLVSQSAVQSWCGLRTSDN